MIVVDRIEGNRAVVEFDGEIIDIDPRDGGIWYSKLLSNRIGHIDPRTLLGGALGRGADLGDALREAEERLARLKALSPPGDEFDL